MLTREEPGQEPQVTIRHIIAAFTVRCVTGEHRNHVVICTDKRLQHVYFPILFCAWQGAEEFGRG